MPREKMIPKPPPTSDQPGKSAFERTADLTRRLLSVPKSAVTPKKKRKHR